MSQSVNQEHGPFAGLPAAIGLAVYLLVVVLAAAYWLVVIFPAPVPLSRLFAPVEQKLPAGKAGQPGGVAANVLRPDRAAAPAQGEDADQAPAEQDASLSDPAGGAVATERPEPDARAVADEAPSDPSDGPETESGQRPPSLGQPYDLAGAAINRWEFPEIRWWGEPVRLRNDQGSIVLALLAGVLGSFVHSAQSLAAYVGNQQLRVSWVLWYTLRPLIGAVLGLLFYFVTRAGLVSADTASVSPYGIVSFGALAGWFSKQATDKLAETFETLFRTQKAVELRDKLEPEQTFRIAKIVPETVQAGLASDLTLTLEGTGFTPNLVARISGRELVPDFVSAKQLRLVLPAGTIPATAGVLDLVLEAPSSSNSKVPKHSEAKQIIVM